MSSERKTSGERRTMVEYERRFSVFSLPPEISEHLDSFERIEMEQGYLPDRRRLRKSVAKDGKVKYKVVDKTVIDKDPIARSEDEDEISAKVFKREWKKTKNARVYKTRYLIPYGDYVIELDVFKGRDEGGKIVTEGIAGRMLAEIESKTDRDFIANFDPSTISWLGPEVTDTVSNRLIATEEVQFSESE